MRWPSASASWASAVASVSCRPRRTSKCIGYDPAALPRRRFARRPTMAARSPAGLYGCGRRRNRRARNVASTLRATLATIGAQTGGRLPRPRRISSTSRNTPLQAGHRQRPHADPSAPSRSRPWGSSTPSRPRPSSSPPRGRVHHLTNPIVAPVRRLEAGAGCGGRRSGGTGSNRSSAPPNAPANAAERGHRISGPRALPSPIVRRRRSATLRRVQCTGDHGDRPEAHDPAGAVREGLPGERRSPG